LPTIGDDAHSDADAFRYAVSHRFADSYTFSHTHTYPYTVGHSYTFANTVSHRFTSSDAHTESEHTDLRSSDHQRHRRGWFRAGHPA
jgi:hypothetical protein